jgi:hypothetical protein
MVISSSNNFGSLIGFSAGTYPNPVETSNYSVNGDLTPYISPASSFIMQTNVVFNPYSQFVNSLYAITPGNTAYGEIIKVEPSEYAWTPIVGGVYSYVELRFSDQLGRQVKFNDADVLVILQIKPKGENGNGKR